MPSPNTQPRTPNLSSPALMLLTLTQLWLAHALVFFCHEYAHTVTAWLLGWKSNPFSLHWPHLSLIVLLIQSGINQGVDEAPIFASGHGPHAALIAGAGVAIGNGLLSYGLSRFAYARSKRIGARVWAMLFYWTTVASIGNFFDYVPIRTFTLDGDMGSIQRGFGCSAWAILVVLGVPTLLALVYFFAHIEPRTLAWLFPNSAPKRIFFAILTAFALFGFYGAAGLLEGGHISHKLSTLSVTVLLPLTAVATSLFTYRRADTSDSVELSPVAPISNT